MGTDKIEKKILLRAPQGRIWRALSDYQEFGHWFGVKFDRPFVSGATMSGAIVGTGSTPRSQKLKRSMKGSSSRSPLSTSSRSVCSHSGGILMRSTAERIIPPRRPP